MDNLDKNWQLVNILFCGHQRRSYPPKMRVETYTRQGTVGHLQDKICLK